MKKLLIILLLTTTANTLFAQRKYVIKTNGYSNSQVDSGLNKKLNISDTASMLSPLWDSLGNYVRIYRGFTDSSTDNYAKLQDFINTYSGEFIFIPQGNYYVSSPIHVPANTSIIGNNPKIFNTSADTLLVIDGSNVLVQGIELQGIGNDTISASNIGIFHQTISAPDSNVIIKNCFVHDMGNFGIYLVNLKNSKVENAHVLNVGYTGIGIFSSDNTNTVACVVDGVTVNGVGNAYGISYSVRVITSDSLYLSYPKNSRIENNIVRNIYSWHGIDIHSGKKIKVENNIVDSCSTGIYLTSFTYYPDGIITDTVLNPAEDIDIIENEIDCKSLGNGISVFTSDTSLYSQNIKIIGNTIRNAGINNQAIGGSISAYRTKNLDVSNNIIKNAITSGIVLGIKDSTFNINSNTIRNVFGTSITHAILITDSLSTGTVSNNTVAVDSTGASHSNEYGIYVSSANNKINVPPGNYISTKVTTDYSLNSTNIGLSIPKVYGTTGTYAIFNGNALTDGSITQSGSAAIFGSGGTRPITFNYSSGILSVQGSSGGWAGIGFLFYGSSGTALGGFGAQGAANSLTKLYVGSSYSSNGIEVYPSTYTIPNWVKLNGVVTAAQKISYATPQTWGVADSLALVPKKLLDSLLLQKQDTGNASGATSGLYTPTLTGVANYTSGTPYQCQYSKIGNTVTVYGKVTVKPTTTATITTFTISLPAAATTTFTSSYEGAGTGGGIFSSEYYPYVISSSSGASTLTVSFISNQTSGEQDCQFHATYQIQ